MQSKKLKKNIGRANSFLCLSAILALVSCSGKQSEGDATARGPATEGKRLGAQAVALKAESLPDGLNMRLVDASEEAVRLRLKASGLKPSEQSRYSGSFELLGTTSLNGKHIFVALNSTIFDLEFPKEPKLNPPVTVSLFDVRPTLALAGGGIVAVDCGGAICAAEIGARPGKPSPSSDSTYSRLCSGSNPARNDPICIDYCNKCSSPQRDNDILNGVNQIISTSGAALAKITQSSIISTGNCATVIAIGAAGNFMDTSNSDGMSNPSNPGTTPLIDQYSHLAQWACTASSCLSPGAKLAAGYVSFLNAVCSGAPFIASAITCTPGLAQKAGLGKDLGTACSELADAALPINPDECPINTSVMACDQNGNPRTSSWATECRAVVDKAMNVKSIVNLTTAAANCINKCVKNTKAAADLCVRPPPPPSSSDCGTATWTCIPDIVDSAINPPMWHATSWCAKPTGKNCGSPSMENSPCTRVLKGPFDDGDGVFTRWWSGDSESASKVVGDTYIAPCIEMP